jgi:hypothetical protein
MLFLMLDVALAHVVPSASRTLLRPSDVWFCLHPEMDSGFGIHHNVIRCISIRGLRFGDRN